MHALSLTLWGSYVLLSLSSGPAEGSPIAASASSAGWVDSRSAELLVGASMALGVLLGSPLSLPAGRAILQSGSLEAIAFASAAVVAISLVSRVVPVSLSQIVLSGSIGAVLISGALTSAMTAQVAFWVASPLIVFLLTPLAHNLIKVVLARATSVKALDLTLRMMVRLSLVLLGFWRGSNLGGILIALIAPHEAYWEFALLTATLVLLSCLCARLLPVLRAEMADYPDPAAFASRSLSSLVGVCSGLMLGVTASFSQLFYASDLHFRAGILGARPHIGRRLLFSYLPAVASGMLVLLASQAPP